MNRFALTNVSTPEAAVNALKPPGPAVALTFASLNTKRPLAGGSDLLGEIKDGLIAPGMVVNLKPIAGWRGISLGLDGTLGIGATTAIADVADSAEVRRHCVALAEAAGHVGSPQIRNQGTVGGNLCQRPRCWYYRNVDTVCLKKGGDTCLARDGENKYHAIFGSECPCVMVSGSNLGVALLALDGAVRVFGADGEREVAIADFFRLPTGADPFRETILAPDELVSGVTVPVVDDRRSAFMQIAEKADFDWALVSAATSLTLDGQGNIADIRLALNAVAPIPWRLTKAEDYLRGKPPTAVYLQEAARLALAEARPLKDNAYKVPIAKALIQRVVLRAIG
jgi:xanthine dehydrogenase YagS FAD-binding subunit